MANNNLDDYKPPQPFEYEQPDLPSSTSQAAEEAFDERKQTAEKDAQAETDQNEEAENKKNAFNSLLPSQQFNIASKFNQKKQAGKLSSSTEQDKAMAAAADVATKIPTLGWIIKVVAFLIKGLKAIFGPSIASFISFFIVFFSALFSLNILPIVGFILQIIFSICLSLVCTVFFQKKIMAFVDQAGKITPGKATKK